MASYLLAMTKPDGAWPLRSDLTQARTTLERLLEQGQSLREEAGEVVRIIRLPLLERLGKPEPAVWLKKKGRWIEDVTSVIKHIFAVEQPVRRFDWAGFPLEFRGPSFKPTKVEEEVEQVERARQVLDAKLDALRSIVAMVEPRRRVFLVHGRSAVRHDLARLLKAFGLEVLAWRDAAQAAGKGSTPTTLEVVKAGMATADAVVVLFTPDDIAYLREDLRKSREVETEQRRIGQPRMNVLFEAGMAMAIDQARVVLVEVGEVRPFTDIAGINLIRLTNAQDSRRDLAGGLADAKLEVRLDESPDAAWRTVGSFE